MMKILMRRLELAVVVLIIISVAGYAEKVRLIEVTVERGDTLHGFANRYFKDPTRWPEIYKYNKEGHWINQVRVNDGVPNEICDRTIEYYKNGK